MKILMVTSEAVPFAKTGGLADAVSALSLALSKQGHDVRIVMPRYYKIDRSKLEHIPGPMGVHPGYQEIWTGVYQGSLPDSTVPSILSIMNRVSEETACTGSWRNRFQRQSPTLFPSDTRRFSCAEKFNGIRTSSMPMTGGRH